MFINCKLNELKTIKESLYNYLQSISCYSCKKFIKVFLAKKTSLKYLYTKLKRVLFIILLFFCGRLYIFITLLTYLYFHIKYTRMYPKYLCIISVEQKAFLRCRNFLHVVLYSFLKFIQSNAHFFL